MRAIALAALTVASVLPAEPRAGQPVTVATSRPAEVCLEPVAGRARCAATVLAEEGGHRAAFGGLYAGRWTVTARAGDERVERPLAVRPRGRRLVVLAVGDSLMRVVSQGLHRRLDDRDDVVVRDDRHAGSGLSKPCCIDWVAHARTLVERRRPDVVLVFLGGNEGYSFTDTPCCGDPWIVRYAERQRALMQALAQGGRARVHWSTMPAPAPGERDRRTLWAAENRALELSTAEDDARVLDVDALVSPGSEYRRTMRWRGERRVIRQPDGIHLSRWGGDVVAAAFLRRLRAEGVLARG